MRKGAVRVERVCMLPPDGLHMDPSACCKPVLLSIGGVQKGGDRLTCTGGGWAPGGTGWGGGALANVLHVRLGGDPSQACAALTIGPPLSTPLDPLKPLNPSSLAPQNTP